MALAALFLPVPPGAAERSYSVQVDGKPVVFSSIGPVDVSGRVLVPLRGVLERTGANVTFGNRGDMGGGAAVSVRWPNPVFKAT